MVNNLQFLRSLNTGTSPVGLSVGEIAFNLSDKLLFVGSGGDIIVRLNGTTESVSAGTGYFESDLTNTSANAYTDQKIAELIDAAPDLLNTLNELAAAIADDPNFVTTITTAVSGVQTNLNNEVSRAQAAEGSLTASLNSEVSRAQGAEGVIAGDLAAEIARAEAAEGDIAGDLATESNRAQGAENSLNQALAQEVSRAQGAENQLGLDVWTETQRATAAENALSARIGAIENGIDLGTFDAPQGGGGMSQA